MKHKIFYIDDDKFLVDMYRDKLEGIGAEVRTRENAIGDFVTEIAEYAPDLVILDVVMPGPDGFEAIQMLKADERTKNLSVVFLTNLGQKEDIGRGLALGAVGYIVMASVTPTEVAQKIVGLLSHSPKPSGL